MFGGSRLLTPGLVGAALACWAIPAFGLFGGALGLRSCPDECHSYVTIPIAGAVLLWPLAVAFAAAGAWAWNRTGHALAAPRAVFASLVATATAAVVAAFAGGVVLVAPGPAGGNPSPHLSVFALVALGVLAVACGALAVGVYHSELRGRR